MVIQVKILGTKSRQRYAVKRLVTAAREILRAEYSDLEVNIVEIADMERIAAHTPVLIAPGLVIDEKLVYDLWIPSKDQVVGWMRAAIHPHIKAIL